MLKGLHVSPGCHPCRGGSPGGHPFPPLPLNREPDRQHHMAPTKSLDVNELLKKWAIFMLGVYACCKNILNLKSSTHIFKLSIYAWLLYYCLVTLLLHTVSKVLQVTNIDSLPSTRFIRQR